MRRLALLLPVAGLLVACGAGAKTYSVAKSRSCLVAHGTKVGGATGDIVASTATGGAFRARLADNSVTVVFGATTADANNIDDAYRRFSGKNVGINDVLLQQGNAVMLWHQHPLDTDVTLIEACLK